MLALKYDIFILTETWLKESIRDSEFLLNGYNLFRCDRSPLTSTSKKGGGVLIVTRSIFNTREITNPDNSLEQTYVLLQFKKLDLIIGSIYIPPSSDEDIYEKFGRSII